LKLDTEKNIDRGIRAVAVFEATKGAVVLAAGFGLLALLHRDLQAIAEHLVELSHLNPAHHYPTIFVEAMSRMTDTRIMAFAAFAFFYAVIRFVEAYGLWHFRAWAEWFAIVSGSIYIPIEIYEVFKHATWIRVTVLIVNLAIVAYLIYVRIWTRKHLYHQQSNAYPKSVK
jgi:uncharacterized membrane protein (DUF2068 family)